MKVSVFIDKDNSKKNVELNPNSTAKDILIKLKINPVTVIIARKNEIILEDSKLKDKDEIRIFSVISGG